MIYAPHNSRRDLGNFEKPITDLLVEHQIIPDDRHKFVKAIHLYWHDQPDVCLTIASFEDSAERRVQAARSIA